MLRCESLSKSYNGRLLFQNLSFSMAPGEKIALLGRNGSGKTTLFRIITGEEQEDSGSIFYPSHYHIGLLSQHARFSQQTLLEEAISRPNNQSPHEEWKAKKILSGLGFEDEQMEKHPDTISGGFTLRLQLTKLLLSDPDLLLLDEPTNYLDIPTIRWLTKFLQEGWKKEMIIISHDRSFLNAVSTHTMGLHRESFFKIAGSTEQYFHLIREKERLYTKTVEKKETEREKLTQFITRFGAKATKARQAQSRQKLLDKTESLEELSTIQTLSFSFKEEKTHAKALIEVSSLSFQYPSQMNPLFSDLNFSIAPKERIAIAGRNGSGKSTFLKVLSGELLNYSGKITLHPSCKIGYFGQTNIDRLNPTFTIEEEISLTNPNLTTEEIRSIMGTMMLGAEFHTKRIEVLSGGEKSRVLLAKILASPTNLLLLDEPTNHLDVESIEALIDAIESFSGAVVMVSHSEELLQHFSNRSLIFQAKKKQEKTFCTYYPMGYALFCTEIGWEEEKMSNSHPKPSNETKIDSRAQQQQKRALQVQERSRAIKPIQQKIHTIEKEISEKEKEKARIEEDLIEWSQHILKKSHEIGLYQKRLSELDKELEKLFISWENLENELQEQEKRFQ